MMETIAMMIRSAAVIIALVPLDLARKDLVSHLANLVALIQRINVALVQFAMTGFVPTQFS